jgi:hypothetical protein
MNDAPRADWQQPTSTLDLPELSNAAYELLELLPPETIDLLHGNVPGSDIGIVGFVAECHRLALTKHVVGLGPVDVIALIRRHPECPWHSQTELEAQVGAAWDDCLRRAKEELERRSKARTLAATLFDPWADLPPPEWPRSVLRPNYEDTIAALAKRDGCDVGVLSMAYVVAISGAANKAVRFQPFQHSGWSVPPIIYAMPIADSGFRKTAITSTAFAAIQARDEQEWQAYRHASAEWEACDDKLPADKPQEPPPRIVEDVGVEKLRAMLARSPRGTLMLRDEIAPLFDFRRYAKGAGAAERAFYLSAYEGGTARVHRLGRETDHGAEAMSIFGACQPDRLADFKDLGSDGLMQRFVPLVIGKRALSEPDTVVRGQDKLNAAIDLLMVEMGHDIYRTTPEGSALIRETERAGQALSEIADYGKTFQGFCSKLHGLHARLALLLHLLDDQKTPVIPAETIERAARLAMFCVGHARAFYSRTPGSVLEVTKAVAGFILTHPAPIGGDEQERLVASTVTSGVRACRGMSLKRLAEVLEPLVAGGWMVRESPFGDCNAWLVTDGLRDAFESRRLEEAVRRATTRALIEEMAKGRVPRMRS